MNRTVRTAALAAAAYGASVVTSKALANGEKRAVKPYFMDRAPYVFAHRGGMKLAPESTMAAFKEAAALEVDGFEIDIRVTKDDQIVVFHDAYVDRVSEGTGLVRELTLAELRALDFGYHFKDINGDYPFRGDKDAKIVTLQELITTFPDMRINIDIKDKQDTPAGDKAPLLLHRLISDLQAEERVLVTSFHDQQTKRFAELNDRVATGAGVDEVRKAYTLFISGYGHLYQPAADTFQIPVSFRGIRLDSTRFIGFLQSHNLAVGYWVINSIDEMDDLLQKGAHTIVTDRPDLAYHLIKEKYRK
ncbi:glycerophosphodiester phosphodiesterase [Macrococcus hajekii]|uniref:Glycerophosphodiester phosphodiesterase n=1 Tax=Macrococcus hajekii TaxID=198482 RepID=A0A4R6BN67_9STAP|nr:glycerophosphodiester phosphodiesterase [Macrococcus hajekii]TDM03293.1 glycerophosphodiester phosphodiesterase [Macrococcus hajekii]GGA97658.1 glycerophosphoryl diester phosphodiesterase [Macrococcus hajekii]